MGKSPKQDLIIATILQVSHCKPGMPVSYTVFNSPEHFIFHLQQ